MRLFRERTKNKQHEIRNIISNDEILLIDILYYRHVSEFVNFSYFRSTKSNTKTVFDLIEERSLYHCD